MTPPDDRTTLFTPAFVTETNEAHWEDCTFASGLMLANKASLGKYPATRPEREALRRLSDDLEGGSNLYDLRLGIERRYGWTLALARLTWAQFLARMARGDGAVIQGIYGGLGEPFVRWDRKFAAKGKLAAHAMYAQGHDSAGYRHLDDGLPRDLVVMDPLGRGPYHGEWVPADKVKAFCLGLGYVSVATVRQGSVH
jgi:hypothetical protein